MSDRPLAPDDFPAWLALCDALHILEDEAARHPPRSAEALTLAEAARQVANVRAVYAGEVLMRSGFLPDRSDR